MGGSGYTISKTPRPYVPATNNVVTGEFVHGTDWRSKTRTLGNPEPKSVHAVP